MKKALAVVFLQVILFNSSAYAHELLKNASDIFKIDLKGVIHVGAYDARERGLYKSLNVLWIEADPSTYKKLVNNVKPNGTTSIVANFAASNKDGVADFFRTNNKVSSSLLELKLHKNIHPEVKFKDQITVNTKRLDTYFEESKISLENYNAIVIDVQGAELLALEGAVNTLKNISCIVAEINYAELYEGGVKVWELDEFLFKHGFVRADTQSATRAWGDALYINKEILKIVSSKIIK